ncbi:Cof-type HAD-IIB family hydrolase [Mesoplasma photuris]|uniref:Cof-type HAD-IIB family hydrolase n=1 Tax=Mesoplasma photuris TaxID=217731 RepID=UPI0004E26F18|nr:Cof-type HAD-IIB family hydrolase [Mesoplasma photuris]
MDKLKNIKLIITDLDGTVLEHGKIANQNDQILLTNLSDRGINVTIATGQPYISAKPRADLFHIGNNLNRIILSNGALISEVAEYKPLFTWNVNVEATKKMFEKCTEMDVCWLAFTDINGHAYWNGVPNRTESMNERSWMERFNLTDLSKESNYNFENVLQLMIFIPEDQESEFNDWFKKHNLQDNISSMRSNIESMPIYEFTNIEANKGNAIIKLAQLLNIKIEEVLVFGDNMNDITMFEKIPNSVAVANAVPEIKKIAKYTTDTNLNGGVSQFIKKYVLDEEV